MDINVFRARYPQLAWAANDPGLAPLIANMENMSEAEFMAAAFNSSFYKSFGESIRAWEALKWSDPATYNERIWRGTATVMDIAGRMGHNVYAGNGSWLWGVTENALKYGWDENQIIDHLVAQIGPWQNQQDQAGAVYVAKNAVIDSARQWGLPMSEATAWEWGKRMLAGDMSLEELTPMLQEQAKSLYRNNETLVKAIEQGVTVVQFAQPYLEIAARELGVNPATFDLTDSKWNKALSQTDPSSGTVRPLTMEEWTKVLRTDPIYGWDYSSTARQQGAKFVSGTLERLGLAA